MPITKEFGDVRQLIAQAGQVDANFPQLIENSRLISQCPRRQIAIRPLHRLIQNPVISLQLRQLQIRQLHHVHRLVNIPWLIEHQSRIPVHHHQVMIVIAQIPPGRFGRLLLGEMIDVRLLREQGGHLAAMLIQPLFATNVPAVAAFQRRVNTEDGVGLFIRQFFVRADGVILEFPRNLLGQSPHLIMQ